MKRLTAVVAILVAAAVAVPSAGGKAQRCAAAGSEQRVDSSVRAVLFRSAAGKLSGCLKNSGRRTEIARRAPQTAFAAVDGRFAVYESFRAYELAVTDLRDGSAVALPSFAGRRPAGGDAPSIVKALVSTADRAAWAVVNPRNERNEIYASRGRQTFCLAKGPSVDLESLRIKNGNITYVDGDTLRLVRQRTPGLRDVDCSG